MRRQSTASKGYQPGYRGFQHPLPTSPVEGEVPFGDGDAIAGLLT